MCLRTLNLECWLQARRVLTSIRGTADVDTELDDISQASAIAAQVWTMPPPLACPFWLHALPPNMTGTLHRR